MEVLFDVFGMDGRHHPTLHKDILIKLLGYIGKHDPSINPQFIQSISQALRLDHHPLYPSSLPSLLAGVVVNLHLLFSRCVCFIGS